MYMFYSRTSLCHTSPDTLGAQGTAEPLSLVCLGISSILRMELPGHDTTDSGTGMGAMTEVTPYWMRETFGS
jgi:hypothetical protein